MANSGKELSQQERDRIIRLRDAGLSLNAVAREQHVSKNTVIKVLRNNSTNDS